MRTSSRQQGELEAEVLNALWSSPESGLLSKEVLAAINAGGNALALTTVLTVLSRLIDKGLVTRELTDQNSHLYRTVTTREAHTANLMLQVLRDTNNPEVAFSHFTSALTPEQLDALESSLRTSKQ